MGNPVYNDFLDNLIVKLKIYKNILEQVKNIDNSSDKIFKISEVARKIEDLADEVENVIECEKIDDYSLSEEEKKFYLTRFLFFNMLYLT